MGVVGKVPAHENAVLSTLEPLCQDKNTAIHYAKLMRRFTSEQVTREDAVLVQNYLMAHLTHEGDK